MAGFFCAATDTTGQHLAEQTVRSNDKWMRAQKEAFQVAMNGAPLDDALGILARMVSEETAGEARTAFYVVDPDGACLHPITGASPTRSRWIGFPSAMNRWRAAWRAPPGAPS